MSGLLTLGLERTLTYGRLPGGLVMLNWPLHGNDWHWGLERGFADDPSMESELAVEMQQHSLRFAEAMRDASDGWLTLGQAFPSPSRAALLLGWRPCPTGGKVDGWLASPR